MRFKINKVVSLSFLLPFLFLSFITFFNFENSNAQTNKYYNSKNPYRSYAPGEIKPKSNNSNPRIRNPYYKGNTQKNNTNIYSKKYNKENNENKKNSENNVNKKKKSFSKRNYWFFPSYSYNFLSKDDFKKQIGPAALIFGLDITKYFAFDLAIGGRFGPTLNILDQLYYRDPEEFISETSSKYFLYTIDLKPSFILQYKINVFDNLIVRPYVWVGPTFHYVSLISFDKNKNHEDDSFEFGVTAKAGLRLQIVKYLMLGVNVEYLYQTSNIKIPSISNPDLSGLYLGFELGVSF